MENKQQQTPKLKNKILKILPKAAAAVSITFQNSPFSPGRDHKLRSENSTTTTTTKWYKGSKGFSGPLIPDEVRRKPKDGGIETQEPTSPKISCMGQIKQKKKQIQKAKAKAMSLPVSRSARHNVTTFVSGAADDAGSDSTTLGEVDTDVIKKKHAQNKFQKMFFHAAKPKMGNRKKLSESSVSVVGKGNENKDLNSDKAPPVGDMRRFASGRETFANFDWTAQIAPEEMDHRDCFTDVEEEEDEVSIPFSAPILVKGGSGRYDDLNLQPRKEINLWKRRTMEPPRPLQLKPVLTAK
ncbi:hypothetical protein RIF29_13509 [Crotalaria pallida]|uniref:Syringolide-induced protein 14-1-1 n=1 Tax=Crotalaria pallida TaxID=3830 RepID=A0AAN9IPA8_CROPI